MAKTSALMESVEFYIYYHALLKFMLGFNGYVQASLQLL